MALRDLQDATREKYASGAIPSPNRLISYKRSVDSVTIENIPCFIGGGLFNKEEKEMIENYQSFTGVKLDQKPIVGDKITYDGETYKVVRYIKFGTLWTIFGEDSRYRGKR